MTPLAKYRTFWPRFWAGWIDSAIFAPLTWIVDPWIWKNVSAPPALVLWFTFSSAAFIGYSITCHGLWGQTLGKRVMRVRVVDASEAKLSLRQAVLRDSLYGVLLIASLVVDLPTVATGKNPYDDAKIAREGLSLISLVVLYASFGWTVAEFLTMLFSAKRRAIHDYIANSVVVRTSVSDARQASRAGT
jgi:uncharacterized RDD family membrane protein YckC